MMRLHYLQHVSFEGLGNIENWAKENDHIISRTLLFNNDKLPPITDFDWLIILGGPMNVYDEKKYPWLINEKKFIMKAISNNKVVLGICLGAQLISDVLGSRVFQNVYSEIGWYPVSLTPDASSSSICKLPQRFMAFHWHGDTFELPPGCKKIAETEGCKNQAFEYNNKVVGLQFHLDSTIESIELLIKNCSEDMIEGKYTQTSDEILSRKTHVKEISNLMNLFLDNIFKSR